MRIALLLGRLPSSQECARTEFDDVGVLELAQGHDLVMAVDEDSVALDPLRSAGISVHVSDKRNVHLPGGRRISADQVQGEWLGALHDEVPFDLLVTPSSRDLGAVAVSDLQNIPWGVLVASGPTAHARRLACDAEWLQGGTHELWLAASRAARSDLVIASTMAGGYGLSVATPARSLRSVPPPRLQDGVRGNQVVVVATGVSAATAAGMITAALDKIVIDDSTLVHVICPAEMAGVTSLRADIGAAVPASLAHQVILVPSGRDAVAGAFVETADALIAVDAGDLAIPVVSRRAREVPVALVSGEPAWLPVIGSADLRRRPKAPNAQLLTWRGPEETAASLRVAMTDPAVDAAIVHVSDAAATAAEWLDRRELGADVVVGGRARPPWSTPVMDRLDAGVAAFHRRTWPAVIRSLEQGMQFADLVATAASPRGASSHSLAAIPVDRVSAPTVQPSTRKCLLLDHAPLPHLMTMSYDSPAPDDAPGGAPRRAQAAKKPEPVVPPEPPPTPDVRRWAKSQRWASRARLALPWGAGLRALVASGALPDEVILWVKDHRVSDRLRLVLPWKWGLLGRAMKEKW